jgi:PAS domain S-box-containing protein
MAYRQVICAAYRLCFVVWAVLVLGIALPVRAEAQAPTVTEGKTGVVRAERTAPGLVRVDLATKNVLLLFSGRFIAPLSLAVDEAVRATFQRSPSVKAELYAETLDIARFDPERYGPLLAAYLREKFADRKLDLIITSLPQAARFLLKFRKELFPDTPIVFCLADEAELADLLPAPNVRGVPLRIPWKDTLDLALKLHPDTQHVAVIAGTDGLARLYLRHARQLFQPYETRLAFTYLTDRTLPQLLTEVASLPPHTVILYTTFAMDGAGQVYIDAEVSGTVAKAATAPVYSINNTYLGRGITGGHIVDNGAHAARATEIGLRILAGEKPEDIVVNEVPSPPRFDARQLKRWKIAESRLPAGSTVMFKDPSFWEQYRLLILIVGVCLLEGALIVILLVQRRWRKVAEESQRRAESKYRNIFDSTLEGLFETSPQGKPLTANPAMARILGYASPEDFTSSVHDVAKQVWANPKDRAEYVRLMEEQNVVRSFECQFVRRDGTSIWVSISGRRVCGSDGQTLCYSGFLEEITDRRQVEERLRTSEALSTGVLASLPGQMVIVDRAGAILRASESWQEFAPENGALDPTVLAVGAGPPQAHSRAAEQAAPLVKEIQGGIAAVLTGTQADFRLDYAYPTRTEERWANVSVLPLQRPEGGAVIYRQDITAQQRARLEAERLQRDLTHVGRVTTMGEMAAALAHELNQPLTAILSNAHAGERYLAQAAPPLGEVREILQDVAGDARRAGDVIQRLRSLLRKDEARFLPLDVNQVVRDIAGLVHTDAILRNLAIDLDLAPALPPVRGDRVQLQQVLLNLVLNGMEAVGPHGEGRRLVVQTLQAEGTVRVAVRDQGPGIPAAELARIFDTFYTTKPNGMGMGLAISRSIVEAHGGRIWAENNPDRGATFSFTLPARLPESSPA